MSKLSNMSMNYVLNLIINGLPSILTRKSEYDMHNADGFKPYYKWITFNTTLKQLLQKLEL